MIIMTALLVPSMIVRFYQAVPDAADRLSAVHGLHISIAVFTCEPAVLFPKNWIRTLCIYPC